MRKLTWQRGVPMAFRADESADKAFEEVKDYFLRQGIPAQEKQRSEAKLLDIVDEYGPAVTSYPTWHPLVRNHDQMHPETYPNDRCGYRRLDHTRFFRNAFITCPYGDGQEILDAIEALPSCHVATIRAERLEVQLYTPQATPILVTCKWEKPLESDGTIPASLAIPLLLQQELPCWERSQLGETWETMRRYFLGSPYGSRSSLFINQETGQTMKKLWNQLIYTGMFGPLRV